MKSNRLITTLPAVAVATSLLWAAGCSKNERESAGEKLEDAYAASASAVSDAWGDAKDFTLDKSAEFRRRAESITSDLDARIARLKADHAGAKASAKRKAAMDRVTDARAELGDKMAALGDATEATWDSAKAEVVAAVKKLEAAYDDAVADAANG